MLSRKQLHNVCLYSDKTSKRCRYLIQDETDYSKFYCQKLTPKASVIDVKLDQFIEGCRRKGLDPYKENIALGNNCSGYPFLRNLEQGYDKN